MSKLGKKGTYWELIKLLSWIIRQKATVVSYFMKLKPKNGRGSRGDAERIFGRFSLEREKLLSKISRDPTSAVFGTRRKAALHGEGFAWVPDLRSLDKLLEVGVSPYLGFIPSLSTLRIFESIKAVMGRLIGPIPWNRINIKF